MLKVRLKSQKTKLSATLLILIFTLYAGKYGSNSKCNIIPASIIFDASQKMFQLFNFLWKKNGKKT